MKRKKLTKRQILNELLVLEDKTAAVQASEARLLKRQSNIRVAHRKLAEKLKEICVAEAEKIGKEEDFEELIIFFKNHVFSIEPGGRLTRTTVNIQGTKNVK